MRLAVWLGGLATTSCGARTPLESSATTDAASGLTPTCRPGDPPLVIQDVPPDTLPPETDGTWLYGTSASNTWSIAVTGSTPVTLFNFPGLPVAVANDGIYFNRVDTMSASGWLSWVAHDGSGARTVMNGWATFIVQSKVFQLITQPLVELDTL